MKPIDKYTTFKKTYKKTNQQENNLRPEDDINYYKNLMNQGNKNKPSQSEETGTQKDKFALQNKIMQRNLTLSISDSEVYYSRSNSSESSSSSDESESSNDEDNSESLAKNKTNLTKKSAIENKKKNTDNSKFNYINNSSNFQNNIKNKNKKDEENFKQNNFIRNKKQIDENNLKKKYDEETQVEKENKIKNKENAVSIQNNNIINNINKINPLTNKNIEVKNQIGVNPELDKWIREPLKNPFDLNYDQTSSDGIKGNKSSSSEDSSSEEDELENEKSHSKEHIKITINGGINIEEKTKQEFKEVAEKVEEINLNKIKENKNLKDNEIEDENSNNFDSMDIINRFSEEDLVKVNFL